MHCCCGSGSSLCRVHAPPWMLCQALLRYRALAPHRARCTAPAGRYSARSVCPSGSSLQQPQKHFKSQSSTFICSQDLRWQQKRFLLHHCRVLLISSKHPSLPLGSALALQSREKIPLQSWWGTSSITLSGLLLVISAATWREASQDPKGSKPLLLRGRLSQMYRQRPRHLFTCSGLAESTIALECPVPGRGRQLLSHD